MYWYIKYVIKIIFLLFITSGIFSDINWYSNLELEAANTLALKWIINDNSTKPEAYNLDDYVLRQEIWAVARGIAWLEKKSLCNNIFNDVSETTPNSWACFSIEALADAWLIAKNTNFNPEKNISKAEALGMMINAVGLNYSFDSSIWTTWQEQVVSFAVKEEIIDMFSDYDTFATRWWVFKVGVNSLNAGDFSSDEEVINEMEEIINSIFWSIED